MLFSKPKSQLGIDIGTSSIKLVELKPAEHNYNLVTYGIAQAAFNLTGKDSASSIKQAATVLKELMKRAGVTTNKAVASLPNSTVFTSLIELPKIPDSEMKTAIEFEAKKYVPMPLEEVTLSWTKLEEHHTHQEAGLSPEKQKILLTAVPSVVIDSYVKLFQAAGIEPQALEIEALSLIRSIIAEDTNSIVLVDIGAKITTVNLVDNGYLRLSKSLSVGGDSITSSLSQSLSVNFARAEQFKKDFGMTQQPGQTIPQVMRPVLDIIKNETIQLVHIFESRGGNIDKVILSGSGSKLAGLNEYFGSMGKKIALANPWTKISYPADLKPVITPLGLNLSVAVGLAMRPM